MLTWTFRPALAAPRRARARARASTLPDAFGYGVSPEMKASEALKTLFTIAAVRTTLDQELSYDNEGGSTALSSALAGFLETHPLRNGDERLEALMRDEPQLRLAALRLMETRAAYARENFDWQALRDLAVETTVRGNDALMVKYVEKSM